MLAVEFEEQNVIYAKDQPEYANLPACADNSGTVTFCFELDYDEIEYIKEHKGLKTTFVNHMMRANPFNLSVEKPTFPVPREMRFNCNPVYDGGQHSFSTMLSDTNLEKVVEERLIWVTVNTFGQPLQPVVPTVWG